MQKWLNNSSPRIRINHEYVEEFENKDIRPHFVFSFKFNKTLIELSFKTASCTERKK